jgi:hypothetical protein
MTVARVAWGVVTSGFRINRFIAKDARLRGNGPADELLEDFRSVLLARTHLPGLSPLSVLVDIVVHQMVPGWRHSVCGFGEGSVDRPGSGPLAI